MSGADLLLTVQLGIALLVVLAVAVGRAAGDEDGGDESRSAP